MSWWRWPINWPSHWKMLQPIARSRCWISGLKRRSVSAPLSLKPRTGNCRISTNSSPNSSPSSRTNCALRWPRSGSIWKTCWEASRVHWMRSKPSIWIGYNSTSIGSRGWSSISLISPESKPAGLNCTWNVSRLSTSSTTSLKGFDHWRPGNPFFLKRSTRRCSPPSIPTGTSSRKFWRISSAMHSNSPPQAGPSGSRPP